MIFHQGELYQSLEPHLALFAENDGLYFYQEIISKCSNYLNKKSIIAFEIGYLQAEKIKEIAITYFPKSKIIIEKDLQGKDRFLFIINE